MTRIMETKNVYKKKLENTKQGKNLIWSGKPKVSNKKLQHIRHKALIIKRIKKTKVESLGDNKRKC